MIAFEVKDMTCGHCVSTITKALKATDKDAKVQIDLATHHVRVEPERSCRTGAWVLLWTLQVAAIEAVVQPVAAAGSSCSAERDAGSGRGAA